MRAFLLRFSLYNDYIANFFTVWGPFCYVFFCMIISKKTTIPSHIKSLVRPHLEYGNVIWSPATVNEIILIEGVQRRATAMIKKCKGLSYEERLRKLGIPTLEYRRHRADLIQVYRLFSGIDRMDANVFFSLHNEDEACSVRAETRGHPRKLSKNRYVRRLGRDSFAFRVVNPWNKLPLDVVMAPNLNSFKSRLNVHYKNFPLKFCPSFMSAR